MEKLSPHADAKKAAPMKSYMKNRYEFLGIKTPERKALLKELYAENDLPEFRETRKIVNELFRLPEREFHYSAIEFCGKFKRKWTPKSISLFEKMILTKSWWDTVDSVKSVCLRDYFLKFPDDRYEITQRWIDSGNIWLQRLSVIFQLGYKEKTDVRLLKRNILQLNESEEFFVQKAIGWALRDYARADKDFVIKFVSKNKLKPLSNREALKNVK